MLIGFAVMMLCVGFGIAALIATVPMLFLAMKIASIAYVLVLAWQIATAEATDAATGGQAKPMGFLAAAAPSSGSTRRRGSSR